MITIPRSRFLAAFAAVILGLFPTAERLMAQQPAAALVPPPPTAAPKRALSRFVNLKGSYTIAFPLPTKGELWVRQGEDLSCDADIDGAGFIVLVTDIDEPGAAETFFDAITAEALRATGAHVVRQRSISLAGNPGREVEIENDRGWQRFSRHYLLGKRYVQVCAQARDRQLDRELVFRFLDSFELIVPGQGPIVPAPAAPPAAGKASNPSPADAEDDLEVEHLISSLEDRGIRGLRPVSPLPAAPQPTPPVPSAVPGPAPFRPEP